MTDLIPGEKIWTIGMDMQCRKVVCPARFDGIHEDGRPIVIGSDGVRVIYGWDDIFKTESDARGKIEHES